MSCRASMTASPSSSWPRSWRSSRASSRVRAALREGGVRSHRDPRKAERRPVAGRVDRPACRPASRAAPPRAGRHRRPPAGRRGERVSFAGRHGVPLAGRQRVTGSLAPSPSPVASPSGSPVASAIPDGELSPRPAMRRPPTPLEQERRWAEHRARMVAEQLGTRRPAARGPHTRWAACRASGSWIPGTSATPTTTAPWASAAARRSRSPTWSRA